MNLLKIFFLSIFILIFSFTLNAQDDVRYFRSNTNGLELVEISVNKFNDYEYVLRVNYISSLPQRKILYKKSKETKRWELYYSDGRLNYEKYFKEGSIIEDYRYDTEGHIVKKSEYKNNDKIRLFTYQYNGDGLVDTERTQSLHNNSLTITKYRYDTGFRIKQIEKKYPDGRLVYWEAFFTDRGIIQKEYYTLKDERFIFLYNEFGQEVKGEVIDLSRSENNIKKEWKTFYTKNGKIERKEEANYTIGLKRVTFYNSDYKERRIETYENDEAVSIENFDYNKNGKLLLFEKIEDLNSNKTVYRYDENDKVIKTFHYENDALKKEIRYNEDGSRTEVIYGKSDKKILLEYDKNGKLINQEIFE